jgi:hypothetical protein
MTKMMKKLRGLFRIIFGRTAFVILFMAMFVTAFSATLLGLGKSRGNATDVFSPMGEDETKSA